MGITYTTNYNLGKQEDLSDKFLMSVITNDMDIIDTTLYNKQDTLTSTQLDAVNSGITADIVSNITTTISTVNIDNTVLATMYSGTICGVIDATIYNGNDDAYGIVRAYTLDDTAGNEVYMQIAEFFDNTSKTRLYSNNAWSVWEA